MTSAGVNDADSLATIEACFDLGINHLDTAYAYGLDGESERLIAKAMGQRRDQMVIATKGGIHWGSDRKQVLDGRPETLRRECETSLKRLNTDRVELYYLHAPDPKTPVAESAGAIKRLMEEGKVLAAGFPTGGSPSSRSSLPFVRCRHFSPLTICCSARSRSIRCPGVMAHDVSVLIYWPLMKGMLTGKFARDHQFPPATAAQISGVSRRRVAKEPRLARRAAYARQRNRSHRDASRHQLDDSPKRNHIGAMRRRAAGANSRKHRRDGLGAGTPNSETHRRALLRRGKPLVQSGRLNSNVVPHIRTASIDHYETRAADRL